MTSTWWLKTTPSSAGQKSQQDSLGFLCRVSQGQSQAVARLGSYLESLNEDTTPELMQVVGRFLSLEVT